MKERELEVGVVFAHTSTGETMMIEVLRSVYGVTNEELRESVFEMALGTKPVRVRVPGPITLLKAKIANAADLPQTGRQDARHVAILLELMPAFLSDLAASIPKERRRERDFIDKGASLREAGRGCHTEHTLEFVSINDQCPPMDQSTLLKESRSKHTLRNSDTAAKQLRVFKAALPITSSKSGFSATTPAPQVSSSHSTRKN